MEIPAKPLTALPQLGSSQDCCLLRRSPTPSFLALAVVTLSLCGCFKKPAPPILTEVTFSTPVRQDVPVYSQWIGTTVGFIDAEIHSKVTGYLMAQDYLEGSLVKTTDPHRGHVQHTSPPGCASVLAMDRNNRRHILAD